MQSQESRQFFAWLCVFSVIMGHSLGLHILYPVILNSAFFFVVSGLHFFWFSSIFILLTYILMWSVFSPRVVLHLISKFPPLKGLHGWDCNDETKGRRGGETCSSVSLPFHCTRSSASGILLPVTS